MATAVTTVAAAATATTATTTTAAAASEVSERARAHAGQQHTFLCERAQRGNGGGSENNGGRRHHRCHRRHRRRRRRSKGTQSCSRMSPRYARASRRSSVLQQPKVISARINAEAETCIDSETARVSIASFVAIGLRSNLKIIGNVRGSSARKNLVGD